MAVEIVNNSDEIRRQIKDAIIRGLERCGMQGESYAKDLVPVDTGNLRNSITHKVDTSEPAVIIGTNNEYAA